MSFFIFNYSASIYNEIYVSHSESKQKDFNIDNVEQSIWPKETLL